MDWWERGFMPGDRRRINRCQSRSNRLASTASACRSLIFIAAPSCGDAALTPNRFRSSLGRLRQSIAGLCPTVALLCLTFAAAASSLASVRHSAGGLQQTFPPVSPSVPRGRPSVVGLRQGISGVSRTVELRYQSAAFGHPLIDGHYWTIAVRHSLEEVRRKTFALHRLCGNVGYSSVDVQCLRFARDKKRAVKQGCALLDGS